VFSRGVNAGRSVGERSIKPFEGGRPGFAAERLPHGRLRSNAVTAEVDLAQGFTDLPD